MAAINTSDMVRIRSCDQTGRVMDIREDGSCQVLIPALGGLAKVMASDLEVLDERSHAWHTNNLRRQQQEVSGYLEQLASAFGAMANA